MTTTTTEARMYGRKAYGPQRRMTPDEKARNVAQAIALRMDEGRDWRWAEFGLEHSPQQQALVLLALRGLR